MKLFQFGAWMINTKTECQNIAETWISTSFVLTISAHVILVILVGKLFGGIVCFSLTCGEISISLTVNVLMWSASLWMCARGALVDLLSYEQTTEDTFAFIFTTLSVLKASIQVRTQNRAVLNLAQRVSGTFAVHFSCFILMWMCGFPEKVKMIIFKWHFGMCCNQVF